MILAYIENMKRSKAFVYWIHFILQLKNLLHSHVIIQNLNTKYYDNIMKTSIMIIIYKHITHFMFSKNKNGTFIKHTHTHTFMNMSTYFYITIHNGHGMKMMYDTHILLCSYNKKTCNGFEFVLVTFNIKTRKMIHIICVYRYYSCSIFAFLSNPETFIQSSQNDYIIGFQY
jgi:hypothetical protein